MEAVRLLPSGIAEVLDRGGTVVTANQRAARTLRRSFDRQCKADGLTSWNPPPIFAWDSWTAALWRQMLIEGRVDRLLLNRSQEQQLWEQVISSDESATANSLQTVSSLAAMAAGAWQPLCAYSGEKRLKDIGVSNDTRAFQRWALEFTRRCAADRYLPRAEVEQALAAAIASGGSKLPGELLLVGFDSRTYAESGLLAALRDAAVRVGDEPPRAVAFARYLSASENPEGELLQAAHWLRQHVEAEPKARVAVIVPDLDASRSEITRVFRQVLSPELESITAAASSGPFEFALGQALAAVPMIAVALNLLRWAAGAISIEDAGRTILSLYMTSSAAEQSARAEFDAFELRRSRLLQPEIAIKRLLDAAGGYRRSAQLVSLKAQLGAMQREVAKLFPRVDAEAELSGRQRSCSDWADGMRKFLEAAGWAARRSLDSAEFQAMQKWESALDELTMLDFDGRRRTFEQALLALQAIARQTLFAPESRNPPIQIMSPAEAAGSTFDALYFLHASDLVWPDSPGSNPLLGWRLQRELGMPGSDANRDSDHARSVTARLLASAETVVFSYAKQTVDGRQRPSPMLAGFKLEVLSPLELPFPDSEVQLETFEDSGFIPLTNPAVRGGASILRLQAACGFRAFAEKRLWSTRLESAESGIDGRERGTIIHDALEHFWSEVRTQAALLQMTHQQRGARLDEAIDYSFRRFSAERSASSWNAAYLDLQRRRLRHLLDRWLQIELDRPPFEVTLREEEFEDAVIGPLRLSLRVDRVDRLEDGRDLILDYKTGRAQASDWRGERPDDPQLPLYAVLRERASVAAIGFASVRPGKGLSLSGYDPDQTFSTKPAEMDFRSLEEQIADWRRVLTGLAEEFAAGDAQVQPKAYPETCRYCTQRLLCRLDPAKLREELDEDAVQEPEVLEEELGSTFSL